MYIANKVIKFDKEYKKDDIIPEEVLDANRIPFLISNGIIKEVDPAGFSATAHNPANTSNDGKALKALNVQLYATLEGDKVIIKDEDGNICGEAILDADSNDDPNEGDGKETDVDKKDEDGNENPEDDDVVLGNVMASNETQGGLVPVPDANDVASLSYDELKQLATDKGLSFAGNVSKAKLIEMLEG